MGRGEASPCLYIHVDDLPPRRRRDGAPLAERRALDVRHDQVDLIVVAAGLVDLDDVGVRELGERLGLAQEAGAADRSLALLGAEDLQGDGPIEFLVVGAEDEAHAALVEVTLDDEATDPRPGAAEEAALEELVRAHLRLGLALDRHRIGDPRRLLDGLLDLRELDLLGDDLVLVPAVEGPMEFLTHPRVTTPTNARRSGANPQARGARAGDRRTASDARRGAESNHRGLPCRRVRTTAGGPRRRALADARAASRLPAEVISRRGGARPVAPGGRDDHGRT